MGNGLSIYWMDKYVDFSFFVNKKRNKTEQSELMDTKINTNP